MKALEHEVDCVDCGTEVSLDSWLAEPRCPRCGEVHEVPALQIALDAVRRGELAGEDFVDVVDGFRLSPSEATDLLMALGCRAEAAVDVERTVVQGRVPSEWRRLVDRTREREKENYREVERVLAGYGVEFTTPTG